MKKPKPDNWRDEIRKSQASYFPERAEEWSDEDRVLDMLLMGLRIVRRGAKNPIPMPSSYYCSGIKFYFDWLRDEITEKGNQEAADKLYHTARIAIEALHHACHKRPESFRPIARQQLFWPSFTGRGADIERMNRGLMDSLNLSENCPINAGIKGRKSFSLQNKETEIAFNLWRTIEMFRVEEQRLASFDPICSLVMPDLPGIHDVRKLGLTDEQINQLTTLQPLSRQNIPKWWELGKTAFVHHFGENFENHEEFAELKKNIGGLSVKEEKKERGILRREILKRVKQAFHSIAPKSAVVE